ncbi:hypothetical protein BDV25DRAFT_141431 [Aspergillus avenaceus]|uniref:Uncharacterized protein n=1 Tax=Aspergillus avenaceus TaxID=36643 RepID=A0A5N6TR30_ASPAV|nr:hypothetical protein BDV25DRAFT_141431 [Aspergillus avenaceus]
MTVVRMPPESEVAFHRAQCGGHEPLQLVEEEIDGYIDAWLHALNFFQASCTGTPWVFAFVFYLFLFLFHPLNVLIYVKQRNSLTGIRVRIISSLLKLAAPG